MITWGSFRDWLIKKSPDRDIIVLTAHVEDKLVGFTLATIRENGPLLAPDKFGYVSLLVVYRNARRKGVGEALWNGMREWFLTKGIQDVQLYTECANELSNGFWGRHGFSALLPRRARRIS